MKVFALAVLAATVNAWGSPYGDRHSGYMSRRGRTYRATPKLARNDGPTGPRYGPSRPSSRYSPAQSRRSRPSPKSFGGIGNGSGIIGNGFGDGYGHGRGFSQDDVANLEVDINDRDVEFELEADINDQDFENDLEIQIADRDHEREIEDVNDRHFLQDGSRWNSDHRGYGSVSNVGLKSLAPGRAQKTHDQSYNLSGHGGYVPSNDTGSLNRSYYGDSYGTGYGAGYGNQGGSQYNTEKSYDNIRGNIGTEAVDTYGEDDKHYNSGYGNNFGSYGSGYNNQRASSGYGGDVVANKGYGGWGSSSGYGKSGYGGQVIADTQGAAADYGYGNTGYGGKVAASDYGYGGKVAASDYGYGGQVDARTTGYGGNVAASGYGYGGQVSGYGNTGYGNTGYGNTGYGSSGYAAIPSGW